MLQVDPERDAAFASRMRKMELGAPFVKSFLPDEYGAGPQNWAMVQDPRGVMYVANTSGVLEYDGTSWRLIPVRNGAFVRSLDLSASGTVYVGGLGELGYLASDLRGKTVYKSLVDKIDTEHRNFMDVWSTHATIHGVYFVTLEKIYRWVGERMEVIAYDKENYGFGVGTDVYVWHKRAGISKLDQGRLIPLPGTRMFTRDNAGRVAIVAYDRDTLLLFTEKKGCFLYHLKDLDWTGGSQTARIEPFETEVNAYLRRNLMYYEIDQNQKGEFFIPTLLGGVVVMNRSGNLVRILNQNRGLINNSAASVFVDREQNVWLATSNGISHLTLSSPWSRFSPQKIKSANILSITRHRGAIYVGTLQGVFYLPEYHLRLLDDDHDFVRVGNNKNQCWALYPTQGVMLAGIDNQLWSLDRDQFSMVLKLPGNRWVYSIGAFGKFPEHVFLGLYSGGVRAVRLQTRTDTQAGAAISAKLEPWSIPEVSGESIVAILGVENTELWLASQLGGVIRVRFTGRGLDEVEVKRYGPGEGLALAEIRAMMLTDNRLVVTNSQGTYRSEKDIVGPNAEKSIRFVMLVESGNPNDVGIGPRLLHRYAGGFIVEDEQGTGIWKQPFKETYALDRLPFYPVPASTNTSRLHVDTDAVIWMGHGELLYRYDPRVKKNYALDFPALIRTVRVNQDTVLFQGNFHRNQPLGVQEDIYEISATQPDSMIPDLQYESNAIGFGFSAAFYEQSHKTRFRYRLEGFDRNWSQWSEARYKEYTNLPEGAYVFRVQAKNLYGHKSQQSTYGFVIRPPWYRTTLAYIGYVIGLFLVMAGGIRIYTWRLVRVKRRLEKLVEIRTNALQESLSQLKQAQDQLVQASHKAGMAEVATSVLHNVGNVLNSVNVSSNFIHDRLKRSRVTNIGKIVDLLERHTSDLAGFLTLDPKGKVLPTYLKKIGVHLLSEREVILEEIDRLQTSIDHMKNIVSAQQKTAVVSSMKEPVSLRALIDTALDMSDISHGDRKLEVVQDLDDMPMILLEKHKMLQILVNLIHNAIQALEGAGVEKKTLTLRIRKTGVASNHFRLAVIDNGVGIHKENITRIFAYGFTTKNNGNGFGLHSSANAATEMGGSLTCHSEGPGKGSSFYLDLPYQEVPDDAE